MGSRPFIIGVTDLLRRLGTRKPVQRAVTLDGLAISTAAVTPGEDVVVDLELESISNGISATGTITVAWTGECRRCLEPVTGTTVNEVQEIFDRHPVEGETYPLAGEQLDLEPLVHDAALLALPLAPLCEAGCRGPEPDAFPATVEGEGTAEEAAEPTGDPRWAALDQLKFDD